MACATIVFAPCSAFCDSSGILVSKQVRVPFSKLIIHHYVLDCFSRMSCLTSLNNKIGMPASLSNWMSSFVLRIEKNSLCGTTSKKATAKRFPAFRFS